MEMERSFKLPREKNFYTKLYQFPVKIDKFACGDFTLDNGTAFNFNISSIMRPILDNVNENHIVSLDEIAQSSMRFYRTGGINSFQFSEYQDMLFQTNYRFGQIFEETKNESIGYRPASKSKIHSEAKKSTTELFGYGLAINYAANILGIPLERFFFITKSGARADFHTRVTEEELRTRGVTIGALSAEGYIVHIEVKARTGWSSFRSNNNQGKELLYNIAKKSELMPDRSFLAILVGLPSQSESLSGQTDIVIADPGEPVIIPKDEQLAILLNEILFLAYRFGIWDVVIDTLNWMYCISNNISNSISNKHKELSNLASVMLKHNKTNLVTIQSKNNIYIGRHISELSLSMENFESKQKNINEFIEDDKIKRIWFCGIDQKLFEIIKNKRDEDLLGYGLWRYINLTKEPITAFYTQRIK